MGLGWYDWLLLMKKNEPRTLANAIVPDVCVQCQEELE